MTLFFSDFSALVRRHDSIQDLPGAPQNAFFPSFPSRFVRITPTLCATLYKPDNKRLGTRQIMHIVSLLTINTPGSPPTTCILTSFVSGWL